MSISRQDAIKTALQLSTDPARAGVVEARLLSAGEFAPLRVAHPEIEPEREVYFVDVQGPHESGIVGKLYGHFPEPSQARSAIRRETPPEPSLSQEERYFVIVDGSTGEVLLEGPWH